MLFQMVMAARNITQYITVTAKREIRNQQHRFTYQPELRISQGFRLLKSWNSCNIERLEIRLELVSVRTNILFCESQDLCTKPSI